MSTEIAAENYASVERSIFALVRPINKKAQDHLIEAYQTALRESCDSQLRFFACYSEKVNDREGELVESREDGESGNLRCIRLSLRGKMWPRLPNVGWRFGGKASDFCISISSQSLFRISFHPKSGLLRLHADSQEVTCFDRDQEPQTVGLNCQMLLVGDALRIRVAGLEYLIQFTTPESRQDDIRLTMRHFFEKVFGRELHPACEEDFLERNRIRMGKYYRSSIDLGCGTFGDVYYGFCKTSGDPVAIKDVRVRRREDRQEVVQEIMAQELLLNSEYCLHIKDTWCSRHHCRPVECQGRKPEHFYLVLPILLGDFSTIQIIDLEFTNYLKLINDILRGVNDTHNAGVLHRDVQLCNTFVMSLEPPQAVLGDFGKAVLSMSHTSSAIGPMPYCAPEVWYREDGAPRYGPSIDLWGWAFVVVLTMGYELTAAEGRTRISREKLKKMHGFLRLQREARPEAVKLIDLLLRVLVWESKLRIDMNGALNHPAWEALRERESITQPPSPQKHKKQKTTQQSSKGLTSLGLGSTQPFDWNT